MDETRDTTGWALPIDAHRLLLTEDALCCAGCRPDPARTVLVESEAPLEVPAGRLRFAGTWHPAAPWRGRLAGARLLGLAEAPGPWLRRRSLLGAALPLACVAALPGCATPAPPGPTAEALLARATPADLHSHAGRVILSRMRQRPLEPVAAPMREGRMRLVALAMVADTPVTHVTPDNRIAPFRPPAPEELAAHGEAAFARLHALVAAQGLAVVRDRPGLAAALAPGAGPAVVVAAEGADFLEARLEGLERAFATHGLRHLQLVHYRVNELGDIQTEPPEHQGLTAFGAEVVRACNRLGVVVDVAHASFATVQRAVEVAAKPVVLSHTSLTNRPGPRSRQITADHARLVARTGGVIGIWPPSTIFPTLRAYAEGMARAADVVGARHVGLGSDMLGLLSPACFGDYRETPALAAALLKVGFSTDEAAGVLGGNYARVLAEVLPA
ncbi:membrane dipeptidase [Siccirubricoccus sp. KC 17139]|uniref:Membrane dipeptidase n=1 Tax=Siccirubricoccus soli TaxID=2899147 RepID=A0ABT1D8S3_9PROT|nr:membrane dipeptidase [Siccirubricoccus soli]MCO6417584.1 membrane dipeptidase [Siccirubricoccus soli]MCP2683719.1 membrane dipeptidase [Siccirubricoccus soli]